MEENMRPKRISLKFYAVVCMTMITIAASISAFGSAPPRIEHRPATGSLDVGFGAGVTDGESQSHTSEILPDGKIIVGGTFQLANGSEKNALARLNSDGTLDPTFNSGGVGPNGSVYEIIRLSDGKLLIGGAFTTYNGVGKSGIARLNADGTLDPTFNSGGAGTTGAVQGMVLQPDGKILISSNFTAYNGTARFAVARVNADGTLDTTFTSPFAAAAFVEEVDVLSDGRILIGGVFLLSGKRDVMRLNSNGTVDSSFNTAGVGTDGFGVFAMAVQADGKIVIGGAMNTYNGVLSPRGARLNADGSLDATFTPPVFEEGNGPEWIHVLADGKILAGGGFFDGVNAFSIIKLNTNGTLDATFTPATTDSTGYHVALQADAKIVLVGYFNAINGQTARNIVRLNPNGTTDSSLSATLSSYAQIFDIALQPDGKIVAAGNFRLANGVARTRLARFNADGSLDATFNPGTSTFPDPVNTQNFINSVALQPDGKILIGGGFGSYNGTVRRGIARLNTNGSIDLSFDAGLDDTEFVQSATIQHVLVQPDGKIMVGGNVTFIGGTIQLIGRLESNGILDSTFLNGNSTTGGSVQRIIRQGDGKYIVVGNYNNIAGANRSRITRLNADSTHDAGFNPGTGANTTIFNAALQLDGKILIGGAFATYNGTPRARIARVNGDGTLDNTFVVGTGANSNVLSFVLQTDGKVIVGGFFGTYNGAAANRLARLNTDGSLDNSFTSGFAGDATATAVRRMLLQPDGKLLVSGTFRAYNGAARNNLARLATSATPSIESPFDFDGDGKTDIGIFRPLSVAEWWINRSSTGVTFALQFGTSTDRITPADYTGDGKADIAFFRPASGEWYVLRSEDFSFFALPFGTNGDIPAPADYDADGKADFAVFRPSSATWFISQSSGAPTRIVQFGINGDQPVVADYDNDGKADIGIFRNNAGVAEWWIDRSTAGLLAMQFGAATDKPVQGDYTGDGKADVAIWRPSDGNWLIVRSEDFSFFGFPFGTTGDVVAPGDYDGDGKFDATVFRPSSSTWFIGRTTAGTQIVQFGATGDRPIPNAFVP